MGKIQPRGGNSGVRKTRLLVGRGRCRYICFFLQPRCSLRLLCSKFFTVKRLLDFFKGFKKSRKNERSEMFGSFRGFSSAGRTNGPSTSDIFPSFYHSNLNSVFNVPNVDVSINGCCCYGFTVWIESES